MARIVPDRPTVQKEALARFIRNNVVNPVGNYPSRFADADQARAIAEEQDRLFRRNNQVIPRGTEAYRVPSDFDLERLPTRAGESYRPGQVSSVVGSSDLQKLGELLEGKGEFGSQANARQNAIMRITAMEDVPGVRNISPYISADLLNEAGGLREEGLFGPKTRYEVMDYKPARGATPATWNLGAYANMGLGAANILGFLPMLLQGGQAAQGKLNLVPNDPTIGQMR